LNKPLRVYRSSFKAKHPTAFVENQEVSEENTEESNENSNEEQDNEEAAKLKFF